MDITATPNRKLNLDDKDYERPAPDSTVFRDWRIDKVYADCPDLDAIEEYHDFVFAGDAVSFIMGHNRDSGIYDPNLWALPVGNYKVFGRGDMVMIDTVDGKSAVRKVKAMDHRVMILATKLTHLPKIGGEVIKLLGVANDAINKRATEKMNKLDKKLNGGRWL
jgi:hypothetical protein